MDGWNLERLSHLIEQLRGEPVTSKVLATVALLALIYGVHRLARYYIGRTITRPETRVKYWSHSRSLLAMLAIALAMAVWLEELKTVTLVLAGVMAGILITGKEVFLGFAGRFSLAIADHYEIGDRIRINGVCGDVINIGLLYTWLLEVDFDHSENQATGRVVLVPHLWLTQHALINATLGHEYLWDEIELGFPLTVDGQHVMALLTEATTRFLRTEVDEAARNVPLLGRRYAAKSPPVTPVCYMRNVMAGSSHQYLVVSVRFTVRARARRAVHSALTLHLLAMLRTLEIPLYQNFPYYTPPAPREEEETEGKPDTGGQGEGEGTPRKD